MGRTRDPSTGQLFDDGAASIQTKASSPTGSLAAGEAANPTNAANGVVLFAGKAAKSVTLVRSSDGVGAATVAPIFFTTNSAVPADVDTAGSRRVWSADEPRITIEFSDAQPCTTMRIRAGAALSNTLVGWEIKE